MPTVSSDEDPDQISEPLDPEETAEKRRIEEHQAMMERFRQQHKRNTIDDSDDEDDVKEIRFSQHSSIALREESEHEVLEMLQEKPNLEEPQPIEQTEPLDAPMNMGDFMSKIKKANKMGGLRWMGP